MLLEEELVCVLSRPRQPDRKIVAEPPQLIVPATSTKSQWQVGEVGVLFAEQLGNQIHGDLIVSVRHRSNRSLSIMNRTLVRLIAGSGRRDLRLAPIPDRPSEGRTDFACQKMR